jgi:polar amino acid transport system permease protein
VQLSAVTISLGFLLGTLVAIVALVYGRPWAVALARVYVEVIRNTPLIVQLFLIFFGLPGIGIKLDVTTASVLALTINLTAYTAEIVRAGLREHPQVADRGRYRAGPDTDRRSSATWCLLPALKSVYPVAVAASSCC